MADGKKPEVAVIQLDRWLEDWVDDFIDAYRGTSKSRLCLKEPISRNRVALKYVNTGLDLNLPPRTLTLVLELKRQIWYERMDVRSGRVLDCGEIDRCSADYEDAVLCGLFSWLNYEAGALPYREV